MRTTVLSLSLALAAGIGAAGEAAFTAKPTAVKDGDKVKIAFTVSAPTDVEVAVLAADGKVVRHLAAGVLGGTKAPPEPLKAGLSQTLEWDGRDDFGKPAKAEPWKVRVRAGTGAKFGRFLGGEPYNFGSLTRLAADEDGQVYIMGFGGGANQGQMVLRAFDSEGRYLREVMPFAADLPPGAMKEVGQWDEAAKAWRPRNLRNLNPAFYPQPGSDNVGHFPLTLLSVSKKGGITFTDGGGVYRLDLSGAVPEAAFPVGGLWPKGGALPNSGGGPLYLRTSPDGKYLYLSGPFSAKTYTGYDYDARFPPGQVYRMEIGKGTMQPFAKLANNMPMPPNYTGKEPLKAPLADVAADKDGNVLVADRDNQRVALFDSSGKELGKLDVANPQQLAVHPGTGAVYVLTWEKKQGYDSKKVLVKLSGTKDARKVAEFDLGTDGSSPQMALAAGEKSTVLWFSGTRGGLFALEDKGAGFEEKKTVFRPKPDYMTDWGRLATDYARDEVYVSDAINQFRRYDGASGEGGPLARNGKLFRATDLAVGYDGLLYIRTGESFSGPFERFTRELAPAPFAGGTHVLNPSIYNRYGVGFAERGIGVGPDGKVYHSHLYKFVAYYMRGWGPDGKEFTGKGVKDSVMGPIPQAHGGIRVDLKGNLYLGILYWPKDAPRPKGKEKDEGYINSVGSVVKFPPEGGRFGGGEAPMRADSIEGSLAAYPGLAPFSRQGWGGNTCCVCRTPRFDLDPYGRLILPNALTNSVSVLDNAGNLIVEFGKYGNFDSLYVNPNTEAGKAGKPTVAVPEMPLAWPTCAGFTEKALYALDTYNRRALRIDPVWKAEETCEVK